MEDKKKSRKSSMSTFAELEAKTGAFTKKYSVANLDQDEDDDIGASIEDQLRELRESASERKVKFIRSHTPKPLKT